MTQSAHLSPQGALASLDAPPSCIRFGAYEAFSPYDVHLSVAVETGITNSATIAHALRLEAHLLARIDSVQSRVGFRQSP